MKKLQGDSFTLSDKSLEYFLFLFRSQQMYTEILDLCSNFNYFTNTSASDANPIKSYYLADALLQIPSK